MRRRRYVWPILIWTSCIVVLGRKLLRRVVIRVIRVHVSIRYGTALLVLQVLVILSPPAHILRHPLLARRQMTTVHHAGLGVLQTNRVLGWVGSCEGVAAMHGIGGMAVAGEGIVQQMITTSKCPVDGWKGACLGRR
jgi:hypothetical protein